MLTITIIDHDLDRINTCEASIRGALRQLQIQASVTQVSEPPFLARLNMWDRLPVLEIQGNYWSRPGNKPFTVDEIITLLKKGDNR